MRLLYSLQSADHRLLLLLQQSQSWVALNSRRLSRSADGHLYGIVGAVLGTGIAYITASVLA